MNKNPYTFDTEPAEPAEIYNGLEEFDTMIEKLLTGVLAVLCFGIVTILSYHYLGV